MLDKVNFDPDYALFNKIGTNVPIFIAATGKAGQCAFLILNATIGPRKSKKVNIHLAVTGNRTQDATYLTKSLYH